MHKPNRLFVHILFTCMTVMAGVPSLSLSQGLTASRSPVEEMTTGGTVMVNVAPELLSALESDAGLGLSEQASKIRTFRVYMVAGTGELGSIGDGGLATRARLWFAAGVAVDAGGLSGIEAVFACRPLNQMLAALPTHAFRDGS